MCYYEGMPTRELEIPTIEKVSITTKSHPIVAKSHLDIELHIDVEHQRDNVELKNRDAYNDTELEKTIAEGRSIELRLSKCVRRHHQAKQVIGEKDVRLLTRRSSKRGTCLLSTLKPKLANDPLKMKIGYLL